MIRDSTPGAVLKECYGGRWGLIRMSEIMSSGITGLTMNNVPFEEKMQENVKWMENSLLRKCKAINKEIIKPEYTHPHTVPQLG